jgi:type I restriction enzyme S subunit
MDTATKKIRAGAELSVEVKLFPPGGVLVVCIGATIGKVGISQKPFSANQQINVIVPTAAVSAEFLAYSLCVKADLMRFLSNAATIGILNQERTKEICVAVPPVEEQDAILRFLRNETGKIDALIGKANQSIELMKERRSALISAAVTGKIDVREVA